MKQLVMEKTYQHTECKVLDDFGIVEGEEKETEEVIVVVENESGSVYAICDDAVILIVVRVHYSFWEYQ
jgi:hypothetical protein